MCDKQSPKTLIFRKKFFSFKAAPFEGNKVLKQAKKKTIEYYMAEDTGNTFSDERTENESQPEFVNVQHTHGIFGLVDNLNAFT